MKQIKILVKLALIISALSTLVGCLSPVKTEPENTYLLTAVPDSVKTRRKHDVTILVAAPEVAAVFNTSAMAYTIKPYQIAYFSKNRWAATPTQMLQPLIVQTLQNTHFFRAVVTPPFLGHYDYLLSTQVIKLEQDFTCNPAMFILIVNVELSRAITSQVIKSKQFAIYEPMPFCGPYGGVIAGNRATAKMLQKLAAFTLTNIRG